MDCSWHVASRTLTLNLRSRIASSSPWPSRGIAMSTTVSRAATTASCGSRHRRTSSPAATPTTSSRRASSASTRRSATTGSTRTRPSARSPSSASPGRSSRPSRRPPATSTRRSTGKRRSPSSATAPAATTTGTHFTLGDALPGLPTVDDPARRVVATQGTACARRLPRLHGPLAARGPRAHALPRGPLLRGDRRDRPAPRHPKAVDNALQRVKRKVGQHLAARAVAA